MSGSSVAHVDARLACAQGQPGAPEVVDAHDDEAVSVANADRELQEGRPVGQRVRANLRLVVIGNVARRCVAQRVALGILFGAHRGDRSLRRRRGRNHQDEGQPPVSA